MAAAEATNEGTSYEDIVTESQIFDLAFHPSRNVVAAGLITGRVQVYEYSSDEHKEILDFKHHKKPCNALIFSPDGTAIFTASSDRSLAQFDLQTSTVVFEQKQAHRSGVNILSMYNENTIITGDDDGEVKLWDIRQKPAVSMAMEFNECADFVSDTWAEKEKNHLLVTSGDGHLYVFDIRGKGAIEAISDDFGDELLSVVVIKDGKKVVCGSQEGILNVFTYGLFGDIDDRFPGHPESIESICAIDRDTIVTGSSDGLIRLVQIHPNKLLGVIGEHDDFPIEVLRQNHDRSVLGSLSHDSRIKFWDIRYLYSADDDDEDEKETETEEMSNEASHSNKKEMNSSSATTSAMDVSDEDSNESDDDDDDDDDDDSSSEQKSAKKKDNQKKDKKKKDKQKEKQSMSRGQFKGAVASKKTKDFFSDL